MIHIPGGRGYIDGITTLGDDPVNRLFLLAVLVSGFGLLGMTPEVGANDDVYYDEPYSEEAYPEETYAQEMYAEEPYSEEPYYDQADSDYRSEYDTGMDTEAPPATGDTAAEAYDQTPMDSYQAAQVQEVRGQCQQWAQESGLEGEDREVFVADCVFSQTGF